MKAARAIQAVAHDMSLALILLIGPVPMAIAHEGSTPHATVVQREGGLYSLNLNFELVRALHLSTQPDAALAEFLAVHSSMAPERFASVWHTAVAAWSRQTGVSMGGHALSATRWQWPTAQDAQALLREQLMHRLTGSQVHEPHGLAQARADFQRSAGVAPAGAVSLRLHAALRPLSVTSYRPRQQWVGPGDGPVGLSF